MPRPFAIHYDLLYADKNYAGDIKVLARLAAPQSIADSRVLEIGAGTGNHTARLTKLAKSVLSIEIDPDFADVLETKMRVDWPVNLRFERRPIAEIDEHGFDVAVALFHVLNYIGPNDLSDFCASVAARLRPGGIFIADTWNGIAALRDPPRREVRRKQAAGKQILQRMEPYFQPSDRRLWLDYTIEISDENSAQSFGERLSLYLWSPEELEAALRHAGFATVRVWDYRAFPEPARPDSWQLWVMAKMAQ